MSERKPVDELSGAELRFAVRCEVPNHEEVVSKVRWLAGDGEGAYEQCLRGALGAARYIRENTPDEHLPETMK